MSHPVITLNRTGFRADDRQIIREVDLIINQGETFALLGGNGAGKSTLLDLITGALRPTSGAVSVLGGKAGASRRLSIVNDTIPLFPMLRVEEILRYFAAFTGRKEGFREDLLEVLGLEDLFGKLFSKLSKGQCKRVGLYLALVSEPQVLLMDEPTADLDPLIRERIWKHLLTDTGMTILFTTHDWEEARRQADRISFLHQGELLGTPAGPEALFTEGSGIGKRKLVIPTTAAPAEMIADLPYVQHENEYHIFSGARTEELIGRISGLTLNFSVLDSNLQDAYQYLIKTQAA